MFTHALRQSIRASEVATSPHFSSAASKNGQSTSRCTIIGNRFWNLALAFGILPTVKGKVRSIGERTEHTQGKLPGNITQHAKTEPRKTCC